MPCIASENRSQLVISQTFFLKQAVCSITAAKQTKNYLIFFGIQYQKNLQCTQSIVNILTTCSRIVNAANVFESRPFLLTELLSPLTKKL